jgi:uncharacterized protein YodC (DUF2158 family)
MNKFKIGDVVYLNSGGPAMTIVNIPDNNLYTVAWIDDKNKEQRSIYPGDAITSVNPDDIPPENV